jgi:hypothetical protein
VSWLNRLSKLLAQLGIAQDATLLNALYRLQFAFVGPGLSVPFGRLMVGVSVTAALNIVTGFSLPRNRWHSHPQL